MNSRIRELAEQAGFQYVRWGGGHGWIGDPNQSLDQFAQLIAVECINQCHSHKDSTAEKIIEAIKQDLGVE